MGDPEPHMGDTEPNMGDPESTMGVPDPPDPTKSDLKPPFTDLDLPVLEPPMVTVTVIMTVTVTVAVTLSTNYEENIDQQYGERSKFELSPLFALRQIALSFDIPPHFLSPKGWALLELTYTNALQYSKAEKINVEINIKKDQFV